MKMEMKWNNLLDQRKARLSCGTLLILLWLWVSQQGFLKDHILIIIKEKPFYSGVNILKVLNIL